LFFRYPFVFVQEGQVTAKNRQMPQGHPDGPGGPCLFIVFNDSAIVTERGGRRMAVVGPSVHEAKRFEKIHQTFDLRPQTRSEAVVCITRDGIPVKTTAGATFRIRWKGEPTANLPHPADPDALLQAAAGQVVFARVGGAKEVRNWAGRVGGNLDVELRAIIARYRVDELLEVRDPGLRPRSDLMREYTTALRNMAKNFGAEIIEVRLDPFEFGGDIPVASVRSLKELRLDVWRAPWEGQVRIRAAQAQAGAIRMKEMAQSYAQLELISAITHEFKPTGDESIPLNLIILRFIEVISRMAANPDAAIFLPREALQTLEGVRALLQSGEQDTERKAGGEEPE
jgi:regulator of protease activity HflC (stomatin/prohibitin superfamily)